MASDGEREQMLEKFREAQRLKEKGEVRMKRWPVVPPLLLAWIIVILIVGGIVAYIGVPAYLQFQVVDPAKSFCRLVNAHDYQGAYALFSSSFHSKVSFDQFSNDITTSKLADCVTASSAQVNNGFKTARIAMTFDYAGSTNSDPITQSDGSLFFIFENGGWHINSMQSSGLSMP